MAKKAAAGTGAAPSAAALTSALPDDVKVISIPLGAKVEVDVDVNDMEVPYTIALDGSVVIKSLVDRREELKNLTAGTHRLGWGFAHLAKGWRHNLSLKINGQREPLEERSEAQKDQDHSVGVAFLVVS
jgi:hypothetical protein